MGYKRISIVLSFVILFVMGIPVWWNTTNTYRSNVDFSKITTFRNETSTLIWPQFREFLKQTSQIDHDKQIKSSTEYCLSFTLLNSNPEYIIPKWNFPYLSNKYIQPFINEIKDIANFTIQSKISHYANLLRVPTFDKQTQSFNIPSERLSEYINPNEWRLETTSTNQPTLNFIVYIPDKTLSPLNIIQQKDKIMHSFLIPQYGGVIIHNVNNNNINSSNTDSNTIQEIDTTLQLESEMITFIYQLKELLGITQSSKKTSKQILDSKSVEKITPNEIESAIKRYTAENINISISTLYSLSALIESLPNMLVLDNIRDLVDLSIDSLDKAHQSIINQDYKQALYYSKIALKSSESAFFDKNMLSLLYFPDEHKYAVYTPLFVPVCFPILAGIFQEYKHRMSKRKLKKE
ncbi:phosphatidylinositol glycan [Tieghemostelium lacteum]|uniref:Phosphatidylinositol glycan n=1 Tax=Tieghemostelium lacteum TaxID=361077 RepID=A0A151Z792_TIELA|nr:phosphatidylinositol glycan [Tieghemostelium lacteum]|eukprot:KYQ89829.1 phosphatidylinositol glycan [Tieghemostelium lacteum]